MAGKGRPTVDDKRDNQYRVRLNDEGNQMLAYCSQMTRQPKSQIFRKALEEYYQTVQLNEMENGYGRNKHETSYKMPALWCCQCN